MAEDGGRDRRVVLKDVPRWDPEAPFPAVVADEGLAHLAYYARTEEDVTVVVTVWGCVELRFGPPDVKAGRACEVLDSTWLADRRAAAAERSIEAVRDLRRLRHFVFPFPGSTCEVLADGYGVHQRPGHTPLKAASDLAQELRNV
ncbi:MAG: hypothetical protein KGL53_09975 [Elusimicrobia bacterium]|nr:hypothetical protein [Elusimicrobiota bacterium]